MFTSEKNYLTSDSKILLQKLGGCHLINKLPAVYPVVDFISFEPSLQPQNQFL
jgi:hypothetical protein